MKKIILSAILAATLTIPSKTNIENKLEPPIPQGIEHIVGGFSKEGACAILIAENEVSEKYNLPDIIYIEEEYGEKISKEIDIVLGEQFPELTTNNVNEINKPYEYKYNEYMIILENIQKQGLDSYLQTHYPDKKIRPLDERFSVQDELPMVGNVIHNIGHTYFDMLDFEKQINILAKFQYIDSKTYKKNDEKIYGHPSLLSYYSKVPYSKNIGKDYALMNTSEQFAEIFTYHILDYNYKKNDDLFNKKLEILKESLEPVSKD
ncbi:hypothetical protein HOA59_02640 [archaeon]|nr:hypothetical protein [archaeon]MBT7297355.1 hypothetical protein [archaeon]